MRPDLWRFIMAGAGPLSAFRFKPAVSCSMSDIFFTGVGVGTVNLRTGMLAEDGALAKRWTVWARFFCVCLLWRNLAFLVYAHHNWLADFNSPPVLVAGSLWSCLRDVQRGDDVHRPPRFFLRFLRDLRFGYLRRGAALSIWHLSPATSFSSSGCNTSVTIQPSPVFVKFAIVFHRYAFR